MRYQTIVSAAFATALAAAAVSAIASEEAGPAGSRGQGTQQTQRDTTLDRDRIQDRTRLEAPVQDRLRDRDIYGYELMTENELEQYRNKLRALHTEQEREQFQAMHEEQMRERARLQNKDLVPPGQGPVYGGELMTVQERNEYREQLRRFDSDEERAMFQARHREEMDQRARALGVKVEEAE